MFSPDKDVLVLHFIDRYEHNDFNIMFDELYMPISI